MPSNVDKIARRVPSRLYSIHKPPSLAMFTELCSQSLDRVAYPLCSGVVCNVPVYDAQALDISDAILREQLADEFYDLMLAGSGVFVLKGMYRDTGLLGRVNAAYHAIIESERSAVKGDHFGTGGANDRIWNSFEKHGMLDSMSFYEYYSNPWLALVCQAWLGFGYRITAQVNVVKPGGAAQSPHRDYHLGFLDTETCAKYPAASQTATQHLTLQGAVAHSEMPLDSGPTRLLPFSQKFEEGYMAYRLPQFAEYFAQNHVSVPLELGDGLFFNPALFHAAGANRTNSFNRMANLVQVSSPFGRPMECVQTVPLIQKCWNILHSKYNDEGMSANVKAFISALGEGYPFPVNLDRRPPQPNGMAPESEQDVLKKALEEDWNVGDVTARLKEMRLL